MKIAAWDIELTPLTTYSWTLWPNFIPIQQLVKPQEMLCFGFRWLGQKKVTFKSLHHHGKQEMLETLWNLLNEADALVSWNGAGFDSKHVRREFLENGFPPPSPWEEIDLMKTAKQQFKFPSNKLDYVSQALGVGQKVQHTGFQLWIDCMAGDTKAWNLMRKYQRQDVNLLVDLYEKLQPWIKSHPNRALTAGDPTVCPNCGGTNLIRRGEAYTKTYKYLRFQCSPKAGGCGKWLRGARSVAIDDAGDRSSDYRPL